MTHVSGRRTNRVSGRDALLGSVTEWEYQNPLPDQWDHYPSLHGDPEAPHDGFLSRVTEVLDEDLRACVELTVVAGLSYADAAVELDWFLPSGEPNKKAVWRCTQEALDYLRLAAGLRDHMGGDT